MRDGYTELVERCEPRPDAENPEDYPGLWGSVGCMPEIGTIDPNEVCAGEPSEKRDGCLDRTEHVVYAFAGMPVE